MSISNYRTLKAASTPKGGQKAYDFAEHIEIKGIFFSEFEVNIEAQGDGEDNTAVFKSHFYGGDPYPYENRISLPLYFRCDANNNFSCTVTYYETCNVAGHTYKEVYLFERDNIKFYTAKYIGFIRIIKSDSQCDFVLIDKNIVQ
jgi:hypothetical protein